jgi:ribosomal protein L15E
MIPTWIIEELDREREERERQDRPELHIEAPARADRAAEGPTAPAGTVIVIDILGA